MNCGGGSIGPSTVGKNELFAWFCLLGFWEFSAMLIPERWRTTVGITGAVVCGLGLLHALGILNANAFARWPFSALVSFLLIGPPLIICLTLIAEYRRDIRLRALMMQTAPQIFELGDQGRLFQHDTWQSPEFAARYRDRFGPTLNYIGQELIKRRLWDHKMITTVFFDGVHTPLDVVNVSKVVASQARLLPCVRHWWRRDLAVILAKTTVLVAFGWLAGWLLSSVLASSSRVIDLFLSFRRS